MTGVTTEAGTQQRPWAAVAPWPEDNDPQQVRLHFAAMVVAHSHAYDAIPCEDDQAQRDAVERHIRPMQAAFTAAALAILGDHTFTLRQVEYAMAAGSAPTAAARWLEAAGIDPDEIAPADASSPQA